MDMLLTHHQKSPDAGGTTVLWNNPLYTRNEIDAAHPIITEIAGYTLVRIFSKRYNDWANKPCIVKYDDLYAWHHWEK